jgi:hypothetical protein
MNNFNTSTNHQLIPNSNNYIYEQHYVSIHSNDRDIHKYPKSSEFEIEMPKDYLNVISMRLHSWSMPSNYNVFSIQNYNIIMTFKLSTLYDPTGVSDFIDASYAATSNAFYQALKYNQEKNYVAIIEQGFYNPEQMANELTNKFNDVINNIINIFLNLPNAIDYFSNPTHYTISKEIYDSRYLLDNLKYLYGRFIVVYNTVNQKLWFGNRADKFILTNDTLDKEAFENYNSNCLRKNFLPDTANWGLPCNVGFTRCSVTSITTEESYKLGKTYNPPFLAENLIYEPYPRFFYGDASVFEDKGYWLLPDGSCPGSTVYYIQPPYKINLMGPSYIYMEIEGLNCFDETSPYNISPFTIKTNQTNGVVNSAFAKIALYSTPISQFYDQVTEPYKYFSPPAERIRKIKVKLRYHDGQLIDFGLFDYSFMLEFNLLRPQNLRSQNIQNSFDLSQMQNK